MKRLTALPHDLPGSPPRFSWDERQTQLDEEYPAFANWGYYPGMDEKTLRGSGEQIPLVLFSGGLDSTFLLTQYLRVTNVDVLAVEMNQGEEKLKREAYARYALIAQIRHYRKSYPHRVERNGTLKLPDLYLSSAREIPWAQPITWLTAALKVIDHRRHSQLAAGYLLGDQAPGFRAEMSAFWTAGQQLLYPHKPPVPLKMPLFENGITKQTVLAGMDARLAPYVWTCELPVGEKLLACGRCPACRNLKHALDVFKEDTGGSYANKVIRARNPHYFNTDQLKGLDQGEDRGVAG